MNLKVSPKKQSRKLAAGLLSAALLTLATSALAQVTVTTASQQGTANTWPFTPTWTPATDSLIAGQTPTTTTGNFSLETGTTALRSVNSITSGGSLTINQVPLNSGANTCSTNYVSYGNGSGAGSLLIYTLPTSANGYNLTNITVDGGWANNGRDALGFTVLYSTVANPTNFIYLATVNYNPNTPGNTPIANQAVINNASGGLIAANVAAVEFVLGFPNVENGYCGIGAITVEGTTAANVVSAIAVNTANQSGTSPFTPTWTPETPNLIAGLLPSSSSGNFSQETSAGLPILTDGIMGVSGDHTTLATCGASGGSSLIYTLTNTVNGSDVTNIVVYSGWGDTGRSSQYYTLSYSTIAAPNTYIPITTVFYWPGLFAANGGGSAQANRVAIYKSAGGALASGVANLKFDFGGPPGASSFNNGYQGYSEIVVQGQNTATPPPPPSALLTQDILPASVATFIGDSISFSATYSNFPPVIPQWQQVTTGPSATNNINIGVVNVTNNGMITSTLTLNNLQVANSGIYQLEGLNATNGAAAPSFSTGAPLVVNSTPTPINNIITTYASQVGLGAPSPVNASTNFYPTWVVNTNNDLILNSADGGPGLTPGTVYAGNGNFAPLNSACNGDPAILSDGSSGYQNYYPGIGGNLTLDACGNSAGNSVTYALPSSATGWSLTNITVYGGWGDNGRDELKYQVLYSTVSAPTVFINLVSADYNPTVSAGLQSATRISLDSVTGSAMAQNVAAVEINFYNAGSSSENGWSGYSEIVVAGKVSAAVPVLTQDIAPATAEDVVGSSVILMANFSGATSYQWQKNGTNISGATSTTLTLNNLQLADTATNIGYRLVAINAAGSNTTATCLLQVDPAPVATNNIITAFAFQTSASAGFSPTWDTSMLSSSLIAGQNPPAGGYDTAGDFYDPDITPTSLNQAGGLPVLTDGNYGAFNNTGPHPAFATAGPGGPAPGAGQYVIYTLGSNPNGYNVTNIQIAGGWNDNGRDSQYYTVSYSTVANPTLFVPLVTVQTNLGGYGVSDLTTVRATITPATGVLASNVYAVFVDFTVPNSVPNGYSGYSEISVFGSPSVSAPPAGPVITTQHEETNNTWTVETSNLIANQLPSSFGSGSFSNEGCAEAGLTDGVLSFGGNTNSASCGDDGTAVPWVIFSPAIGGSWNLTNIVVYTLWHDYGRDGQFYNISYSTLAAPTTFLPLASVTYNPFVVHDGRASGNRVAIAPTLGQTMLASNVAAVKFDFTPQGIQDFGWSGYSEIVLQGSLKAPLAFSSTSISGGNLILTGAGGTPGAGYTWLTSTNLTTPLANWTVSLTGTFDGNGAFSNSIPVSTVKPASFFRLRTP